MKEFYRPIKGSSSSTRDNIAFEAEETVSGIGEWFLVPDSVESVVCSIYPIDSGTGKIQITNDIYDNIASGTATPEDWPYGTVSQTTTKECSPPKAIRAVAVTGSVRMVLSTREI